MYVRTSEGLGQAPETTSQVSKRSWLQDIADQARVRVAITQGVRDPNQLTNLVFFTRHPEREKRKLVRGEPQFEQLAQEWLEIRDNVVRRALESSPPPGAEAGPSPVPSTTTAKSPGESPLAIPAAKRWDSQGKDRPEKWQGRVYGLVVHTTGGSLPAHARKQGVYPTLAAVNYYSKSRGCHYVNGWRGAAGGDLLQMANERKRANGVGVTNKEDPKKDQRRSISLGRFEQDLPPILVQLWRKRWPSYEHSLSLLPSGETTANSCYIHVECIPCVYSWEGRYQPEVPPMREGLRFTKDQHDTVAHLACDIARRNGWPGGEAWWRTPRLVGHEDLTPITRHDKRGGWDPGYLREQPYFDWDYVYQMIDRIQKSRQ